MVSSSSTMQARKDATALLTGKWIEQMTGSSEAIRESMEGLMSEPERLGGACLTLLNLCAQYATQSGTNPGGLQYLVDYLLDQLGYGDKIPDVRNN